MEWTQFTACLEQLGYLRYASAGKKQNSSKVFQKMEASPTLFGGGVNRDFPADEERLTECGVRKFLNQIKFILSANGVTYQKIKEDCSRRGYTVQIDNREFPIYSSDELQNSNESIWSISTARVFSMINKLLKEAGSEERIYSLYGGNDHRAIFLTSKLYDLIVKSDFIVERKQLVLHEDSEV